MSVVAGGGGGRRPRRGICGGTGAPLGRVGATIHPAPHGLCFVAPHGLCFVALLKLLRRTDASSRRHAHPRPPLCRAREPRSVGITASSRRCTASANPSIGTTCALATSSLLIPILVQKSSLWDKVVVLHRRSVGDVARLFDDEETAQV
eukprot:scaffold4017_cov140-Isochrysis_galbana.AAC.4